MKKFSIKQFSFIFICISATLIAQPKISFNVTAIPMGDVIQGSVQHAQYVVSNIGDAPLQIVNVRPSCGCTTARNPKNILAPHESDTIEVDFNTANFSGNVSKHINVESSDPKSPSVMLTFTANIINELEPLDKQYSLWFGKLTLGSPIERKVSFKNIVNYPLTIRSVSSLFSDVRVKTEPRQLQPGDTLVVDLTITPAKEGYAQSLFQIDLVGKNRAEVDMRVNYIGVTNVQQ